MLSQVQGQIVYPPKPIDDTQSNSLVTCQLLVNDSHEKRLSLYNILGVPINVSPGHYTVTVEARAKKGKPGINYWYKSHTSSSQKAA